jgi:CRP/FNR family cyclic AMP-dependent transcriptional regulator
VTPVTDSPRRCAYCFLVKHATRAKWFHALAGRAVRREYACGEVLFDEREPAIELFVLSAGVVRLTRRTSSGVSIVIGEETAPCILITPGVFDGGSNCVTAAAACDGLAHVLEPGVFKQFCLDHPKILLRLLTDISRRIRQTSDFIDLVTVGSIRQRVARVLLDLVDECGNSAINLPCSQAKLALSIGTVREVVFRHLKHLQTEGVLHFHGSEIVVDNLGALQTAAGARIGSSHVFGPHATPAIPAYIASKDRAK